MSNEWIFEGRDINDDKMWRKGKKPKPWVGMPPGIDEVPPAGVTEPLSVDDPTMRPGGKKWVKSHEQGKLRGLD